MEAVAQHIEHAQAEDRQQARADYARITRTVTPYKTDLKRLAQVVRLLDIKPDQIDADRNAWTEYQIAAAKTKTQDVHRLALKNLTPQLRSAKSRSNGVMSRRQREENIHAVGRLVTKHSGLLRQAQDAAKRLAELQEQHPFLEW